MRDLSPRPLVSGPSLQGAGHHVAPATALAGFAPGALLVPRGDGTWQVGGDGRPTLVLDASDGELLARWIGPAAPRPVTPRTGASESARLSRLVNRLRSAGLCSAAGASIDAARPTVRLAGDGPLAEALLGLLGTNADVITDDAVRPPADATEFPAITVVAASTTEPDRLLPERLVRADAPHLVVRPLPSGAVVGPLVVPGRTGCLRCTDLVRRDADPSWSGVLQTLTRTAVDPGPVAGAWAAAYAAGQALAYAAGLRPETLGSTVDLLAPAYAMRWRSWPLHPECGCAWQLAS